MRNCKLTPKFRAKTKGQFTTHDIVTYLPDARFPLAKNAQFLNSQQDFSTSLSKQEADLGAYISKVNFANDILNCCSAKSRNVEGTCIVKAITFEFEKEKYNTCSLYLARKYVLIFALRHGLLALGKLFASRNRCCHRTIRRIYTTFVLVTALQNSGTRADRFGHGPLDLHGKICSIFFSVDFSNGTPKTGTALLN